MLKGSISFVDEEVIKDDQNGFNNTEATTIKHKYDYTVWGYAFNSNLSLVLDSYSMEALEYLDKDKIARQFQHPGRAVVINQTNVSVESVTDGTPANKVVKTATKLPVLLGAYFNYMREIEHSDADFVKAKSDANYNEYVIETTYKENGVDVPIKAKIVFKRRSHPFDIKFFKVVTPTLTFELFDEETTEQVKQFPFVKSSYTIRINNSKTKSLIEEGHVPEIAKETDSTEDLDFEFTTQKVARERGMFLKTFKEVQERHPNKDFSWIPNQSYKMVTDETAPEIIRYLLTFPYLAVDTETTGVHITFKSQSLKQGPYSDLPVGYIVCGKPGESFFFPLAMNTVPNLCDGDMALAFERYIKPLLLKPTIYHNASFDALVAFIFNQPTNLLIDTMVAFQNTYGYEKGKNFKVGLKHLTKQFLGRDSLEIDDLTRSGTYDNANFADVPEPLVLAYACPDADNTLQLYNWIIENKLLETHNANRVVDIDSQFSLAIAYQQFWGMHIDTDKIPDLNKELKSEMDKHLGIMNEIIKKANDERIARGLPSAPEAVVFNPNSSQQVKRVAYEYLNIPTQVKRDKKSGENKSTLDKGARNKLLSILKPDTDEYRFIEAYKNYNDSYTMVKNFTKNLKTIMTPDGFTFSRINQFLNTGRLSTSEPAYQNYSVPVKAYITGRKGFGVSDNDFQSIEYKVIAGLSGQERLIDAFQDPNTDYHKLQASNMFNIPYELVTDAQRKSAKPMNFGIPFGMGPEALGELLKGARSPENTRYALKMMDRYFSGQEKVKAFFDTRRRDAVRNGYSETQYGRRRYYNKRLQSVGSIRRAAGNQPIQGTAADSFKIATTRVYNYIVQNDLLGKILMPGFIHDEMLFEIHESIHPLQWLKIIKDCAELRLPGFPPFFLGWGYGRTWKEAKKIEVVTELQGMLIQGDPWKQYPDWDGDAEKFHQWLKKRILQFEIEKVVDVITDAKNDNQIITAVVWGYLTEHIDEEYFKAPLSEQIKNFAELHIADYPKLAHTVNLLDPAEVAKQEAEKAKSDANNADDSDLQTYANSDLDTTQYSETSYADYDEDTERQREHDKITNRLEVFGNYLDIKNKRVFFEMDSQLMGFVKHYNTKDEKAGLVPTQTQTGSEEQFKNKEFYNIYFYEREKDLLHPTRAFITDTSRISVQKMWLLTHEPQQV